MLVVVENDFYTRLPAAQIDSALAGATLIAIDHQLTATVSRAHAVLPAASFAEGDGTLVNYEGRAQRLFQVYDPAYYDAEVAVAESWRWLDRIQHGAAAAENFDEVLAQCEAAVPALRGIAAAAPDASFRLRGMKIARAPQRQSGRTAARAKIRVHEIRATQDPDSSLAFSMEGVNGASGVDRPSALVAFAWAPGWNSPQAWNKLQAEVGGELRGGDPGAQLIMGGAGIDYFTAIPAVAAPDGTLRIAPLYEHFGSEELSARAAPIQARMPAPRMALNPADAARLGVGAGELIGVHVAGQTLRLTVQMRPDLAPGVIGVPVGLPGVPPVPAGAVATLTREP